MMRNRLALLLWMTVASLLLGVLAVPVVAQKSKVIARIVSAQSTASATRSAKTQPPKATPRRPTRSARRPVRKALPPVDPTVGDDPSRDDPIVRAAAVAALENRNAALVGVDPNTGQILTIVNQKLAWESYQPCSTFKPAVALAALEEGLIENDRTRLQLGRRWYLDLTKSLTLSNNLYFEKLGRLLGLAKLREYAERFGFGELASWGLPDEPRGALPTKAPPAARGGVGKVASFGEGIELTPLQLASFISAVSNGGTLFYLQYPQDEERFEPMVKRRLEIGPWLSPVRQGLEEAVVSGTARQARQPDQTILGKTGTCSQHGVRLGWFAGYSQKEGGLAVVVLMHGGWIASGSHAAELAGRFYRKLADQNYLARSTHTDLPGALPAAIQLPPLP